LLEANEIFLKDSVKLSRQFNSKTVAAIAINPSMTGRMPGLTGSQELLIIFQYFASEKDEFAMIIPCTSQ
jgi:hypothetical protein